MRWTLHRPAAVAGSAGWSSADVLAIEWAERTGGILTMPCARIPHGGMSLVSTMSNDTRTYTVSGMTCAHCVASVTEEVAEVAGVTAVDVDLASGRLTVAGEGFTDDAVASAVAEAGYEVVA